MKRMGRKKEAEPVVTKSVREIILERLKALDGDKKTAILSRTLKRQLLSRQRKRNVIVDELR